MKPLLRACCTALAALSTVAQGVRGQSPAASEVVNRALVALGGRAQLERIQTRVAVGTVEVLGGYIGPYRSWSKAPDKLRTTWDINVIHHDLGFDGTSGWAKALTVRELPVLDRERVKRRALFQGLLARSDGRTPMVSGEATTDAYVVVFTPPSGLKESFSFDKKTFLPMKEIRQTRYEEGVKDLIVTYEDYRKVGEVMLPFAIDEQLLELPLSIRIREYRLDAPVADSLFANPNASHAAEPFEVSLATIPQHIYKESDGGEPASWHRFWGIPFGPTESWLANLVVRERYGRQITPRGARIDLFSGSGRVKGMELSEAALAAVGKYPVARFHPQDEIFHFRHHFNEAIALGIDRLVYTLSYDTPAKRQQTVSLEIPVTRYQTKTKLIAPIRGKFIALTGHEFYELGHKYEWSQQFSWDFVGLGENFDFARNGAQSLQDFTTFGRELVAPGDGIVVYTRTDVPDMMPPQEYLKLKDPQWAIGGNSVIIDHGNGEVSCLFHMKQGSVRVQIGDRVKQGQVIGQIGSSGSPGHPHTHYQLQANKEVFGADGLPVQFTNVEGIGWVAAGERLLTPIRGVHLIAR